MGLRSPSSATSGAPCHERAARRHLRLGLPVLAAGLLSGRARPQRVPGLSTPQQLPTVELNATKYRLPSEEQFRTWAAQVPTASGSRSRRPTGSSGGSPRSRSGCAASVIGSAASASSSSARGTTASSSCCSARPIRASATRSTCATRAGTASRSVSPRRARCASTTRAGRAGWAYLRYRELHYEPDRARRDRGAAAPVHGRGGRDVRLLPPRRSPRCPCRSPPGRRSDRH